VLLDILFNFLLTYITLGLIEGLVCLKEGRELHAILFSFHFHARNCRERTNESIRHTALSAFCIQFI